MLKRSLAIFGAAAWLMAFQGLGFGGQMFVSAFRSENNNEALKLLSEHGPGIVNAKDSNGDTALIIAAGRRDENWTGYLLNNGADPNIANRDGETPLMAAARIGFVTGSEWLLSRKAKVDAENGMGETALIIAVQQRQPAIVRLLLARGANADKTDSAAGYSARDYAKRDTRNPEFLRMIEASDAERKAKAAKAAD